MTIAGRTYLAAYLLPVLLMMMMMSTSSVLARGQWTDWSSWSRCSASCDGGERVRSRKCESSQPGLAALCAGTSAEAESCNTHPCLSPVDGNWSPWTTWSSCSSSCGFGTRIRTRTCDNPPPTLDGTDCAGVSNETANCQYIACPIHGNWTEWTPWSNCSSSCGFGYESRTRSCTNPPPQFGGLPCPGLTIEMKECIPVLCPVHGQWTDWTSWSKCSETCSDSGFRTRWRFCAKPTPAHGGLSCEGQNMETEECRLAACTVDGQWSTWSNWTQCSLTCGRGNRVRHRACDSPAPAFGGLNCSGESVDMDDCLLKKCAVDGKWKVWSLWSECSVTCGNGTKERQRQCIKPQYGGKNCTGNDTEVKPCYEEECPIDGQWGTWSNWTDCTASCGGGFRHRSRACDQPAPLYGGQRCLPANGDFQNKSCNVAACQQSRPKTYFNQPPKDAPKAASIGAIVLTMLAILFTGIVVFDVITLQRRKAYRKRNRSAFPKRVSLQKRAVKKRLAPKRMARRNALSINVGATASQNGDVPQAVALTNDDVDDDDTSHVHNASAARRRLLSSSTDNGNGTSLSKADGNREQLVKELKNRLHERSIAASAATPSATAAGSSADINGRIPPPDNCTRV